VALAAIVVILVVACRWLQLLRTEKIADRMLGPPIAWQYRRIQQAGYVNAALSRPTLTWSWMRSRPALKSVGRAHPIRGIRVALGPYLMPQTLLSQFVRWAAVIAIVLGAFVISALTTSVPLHDFASRLAKPEASNSVHMMIVIGIGIAIQVTGLAPIQARWSSRSGELPLLALLPGLGNGRALKRHTVYACSLEPAVVLGIGLALLWTRDALIHVTWIGYVADVLFVLSVGLLCIATVLDALGGRSLPHAAELAAMICLLVFAGVTIAATHVPRSFPGTATPTASSGQWPILAIWVLAAFVLACLVWRNARALNKRPHPFLATTDTRPAFDTAASATAPRDDNTPATDWRSSTMRKDP
jgi:hypothetical protein